MAKILICDPVAEDALEAIRAGGHEVVEKTGMTPDELLEVVAEYDGMVVRSATKARRNIIEKGVIILDVNDAVDRANEIDEPDHDESSL